MNVVRFRESRVPRQEGERARLRVVKGPDYGSTFVLKTMRLTIGRGEDNEIVIADLKASRKHAELFETPHGWALKDLGSANGILFGGKSVQATPIRSGENFTLGETTLEFLLSGGFDSDLLAPPNVRAIEESQRQVQRVNQFGLSGLGRASLPQAAGVGVGTKKSNPAFIVGIIAVAAVFFLMDTPSQNIAKNPNDQRGPANIDPRKYLPEMLTPEIRKTGENFFKKGFREFREKNYLRAMIEFENSLQTDPTNRLAQLYLENCKKAIKDEVAHQLDSGRRSFDSGKFRDAKGNYESVLRLLYRDTSAPDYVEAKEQLQRIRKAMKEEG